MNFVELFGLAGVVTMMLAYMLETRAPGYTLIFAVGCLMAASYAVLISSWPFALVESVWSAIAVRKWYKRRSELSLGVQK